MQQSISFSGQYEFVSWQHAPGIARVRVVGGTSFTAKPYIDNHTFGLSQLDAGRTVPFGQGCNEWRASFYEASNSFNLSGRSLTMVLSGGNYTVVGGASPVVPPTGPATPLANASVQSFPLGWTLPFPGGTTDTLHVGSNGFVRFAPNPSASLSVPALLNGGPTVAALARSLDPAGGGTVTFETDPVAQTASLTFDQVPDAVGGASNTFQYRFDAAGIVELRFGSCSSASALTGWSPAGASLDPGSIPLATSLPLVLDPEDRRALLVDADDFPIIGSPIGIDIRRVPLGSLATLHAFGASIQPGVDLGAFGMPGCQGLVGFDFVHLTANPVGSVANYQLSIPSVAALVGQSLSVQGFALDPAGGHNAFGGLTSNGLRLDVGLF